MSTSLSIAVVCPTAWPPGDDVAWRARAEALALARRGHRVTVLAPGSRRDDLAAGRARLARAAAGDAGALRAAPGTPLVVVAGRAIRAGSRRVPGPFDLAAGLETALAGGGFDIVHVHEPLLPSPALTALRHHAGATAATFHRADPLTGAAFLGPLVQRALARVDVRVATSRTVQRAVAEVLAGEYLVLPPAAPAPGAPGPAVPGEGIAIVARGRDRAGMRFALGLARALGAAGAPYALMGPREAPWRTRTAVPKSIRGVVTVVPDEGPASWEALVAGAAVVLLVTDEDVAGPVAPLAMAAGRCVVAPRGPEAEDLLRHGEDGLVLPAYTREAWVAGIGELLADPDRRRVLGSAAAARVASVDEVAGTLERAYLEALTGRRAGATLGGRLVADLRVRPAPGTDPARLAAACHEAGLDLVAVAAPGGIDPALAVAAAAPPGLRVVVGQEVACLEGVIVGLFLTEPVPDGLGVAEAVSRIRGQGGVVLAPHPETCEAVPPGVLRAIGGAVDCLELLTGAPGPTAIEAARVAGRMGVAVTAGSVASGPEGVGTVGVAMRPFRDARDFVEALAEGTPVRPRRTRRSRRPRPRARTRST